MVLLLVVGLVLASAWSATAPATLGAYDDSWRGTSIFRSDLDSLGPYYRFEPILASPSVLREPISGPGGEGDASPGLLIILGVEIPYTDDEVAAIRDFNLRGGALLIADDTGNAGPLLDGIRVVPGDLVDGRYERAPRFVVTRVSSWVLPDSQRTTAYDLVLDAPAVLDPTDRGAWGVTARTTPQAWLDEDGDGELDVGERTDREGFPLMAFHEDEGGPVVVLSDPGPFTNDLINRGDNREFLLGLVTTLLVTGTVYLDESRHAPSTAGNAAGRALFRGLVLASQHLVVVAPLLMLLAVTAGVSVRPPPRWEHRPALDTVRRHHGTRPDLGPEDIPGVRDAVLHLLARQRGLSREELDGDARAKLIRTNVRPARLGRFLERSPSELGKLRPEVFAARAREAATWCRRAAKEPDAPADGSEGWGASR